MSIFLETAPLLKTVYENAMQGNWEEMAEYFKENDALNYPITISGDTAFHLAVHSRKEKPLADLIEVLDQQDVFENALGSISDSPIVIKNSYGNTVLHEAAINGNVEAAQLLKDRYPSLLSITNALGETPLFTAAAYGQTELLEHLFSTASPGIFDDDHRLAQVHRKRNNSTTILQATIHGTHFETALLLLKCDESLAELEDDRGFTALHALSNMPSAFRSGCHMDTLKRLVYNCSFPVEDEDADEGGNHQNSTPPINTGWPIMEDFWNNKKKHKFASKLVKLMINKHFLVKYQLGTIVDSSSSYEQQENKNEVNKDVNSSTDHSHGESHEQSSSYKPPQNKKGGSKDENLSSGDSHRESHEKSHCIAPPVLFSATSHGIREIVLEILKQHPQAFEQLNDLGQNILHIAVMHRQKKIYDLIKHKLRLPWARLNRRIDNKGYTVLHQVANMEHYAGGTKPGPALRLQEELRWFKRVEKAIPSHYLLHRENEKNHTAEMMFKEKHKNDLENAQKWIKDTSQSCSTVAVLVATVVFAAAYTVPGDYNTKGIPNFLSNRFFMVFTIFDVVSLASSLTSLVMFLSILTSPLELYDFHRSLPRKVMFGLTLLFFSVLTTMVAFGSTIAILVHSDKKRTAILISVAACVPVFVFALMLVDLYFSYLSTIKESFKPIRKALPCFCLPSRRREKNIP